MSKILVSKLELNYILVTLVNKSKCNQFAQIDQINQIAKLFE